MTYTTAFLVLLAALAFGWLCLHAPALLARRYRARRPDLMSPEMRRTVNRANANRARARVDA